MPKGKGYGGKQFPPMKKKPAAGKGAAPRLKPLKKA